MSELDKPEIRVYLTGPAGEERNARLSDLATLLSAVHATLRNVERCLTQSPASIEYEVVDLSHSSADATIVPAKKYRSPLAARVFSQHRSTLIDIEAGRVPAMLDATTIRSFQTLASLVKDSSSPRVTLYGLNLTPTFRANVAKLLERIPTTYGSVSGRLAEIAVRGKFEFVIDPPGSRQRVACEFDAEEFPEVFERVKHSPYVTIYGELAYQRGLPFPTSVAVEDIEYHPETETLSDLLDAAGIATEVEGDAVDLVRRMRDGWRGERSATAEEASDPVE